MSSPRGFEFLFLGNDSHFLETVIRTFEERRIYPLFRQITTEGILSDSLKENNWDVIIYDSESSDIPLEKVINLKKDTDCDLPLILISNEVDIESLTSLIKAGVSNFVRRVNLSRLYEVVKEELNELEDRKSKKRYEIVERRLANYEIIRRFAGNVSLSLNNLLMVILNTAIFISEDKGLAEHLKADVDQIITTVRKGKDFARGLLAVAGGVVLNKKVLDVNSFFYRLAENLRAVAGRNIDINMVRTALNCEINVDENLLFEAFRHIAICSRDLMKGEGTISIKGEIVDFEKDGEFVERYGVKDVKYLKIIFSNSAKGIEERVREHIFEPYFSGLNNRDLPSIGPAKSYGIVWEHNGIIDFDIDPQAGVVFYIYLPIYKRDSKEILMPVRSEYSLNPGGSILIVDDDETVKSVLVRIFREEGYNVIDAVDGMGAIVLVQRYKPENLIAVITDIIMPKMNGLELAKELRKISPKLKVVFMSGYPDNDEEIMNFENSIFIQKPIGRDVFLKVVRNFLFGEKNG